MVTLIFHRIWKFEPTRPSDDSLIPSTSHFTIEERLMDKMHGCFCKCTRLSWTNLSQPEACPSSSCLVVGTYIETWIQPAAVKPGHDLTHMQNFTSLLNILVWDVFVVGFWTHSHWPAKITYVPVRCLKVQENSGPARAGLWATQGPAALLLFMYAIFIWKTHIQAARMHVINLVYTFIRV